MCVTAVVSTLVIILPINAFQNLPLQINVYVGLFGLLSLLCYWRSRQGHDHLFVFYLGFLMLLNAIWFPNAGRDGSLPFYFFPGLIYPVTMFRGKLRLAVSALTILNLFALFWIEHTFPSLLTPFNSEHDRSIDLTVGALCAGGSLCFVVGLVMENYDREQELLTRYARELAISEKNHRDVVENAGTAIMRIDPEGTITFVNQHAEELFGFRRTELVGRKVLGTITPLVTSAGEDRAAQFQSWLRQPETVLQRVSENQCKDGRLLKVSWNFRPLRDERQMLQEILCVGVDVTERAGLIERLQMTQSTMDAAAEQIIWMSAEGRIIYANTTAISALGYSREELLRLRVHDLMADFYFTDWSQLWQRVRQRKTLTFEARERSKDGGMMSVEVAASWMGVSGTEYLTAFIRDISDRKRRDQALRESEERFRQVVETISEVFWIMELSGQRLLYVSPSFERIWGVRPEGMPAVSRHWKDSLHPNDRERMLVVGSYQGGAQGGENIYRILRPDGGVRWVRDRAYSVKDSLGRVTHVVGVAEDITERRELEERLLHRQRLEAVGTLAGGVAHDLNNILTPMLMAGSVLRDRLPTEEDRELMNLIVTGAKRGSSIISQLLTFCRGSAGERLPVHPRELVREMAHIMRETFPRNILIYEEAPPDVWIIDAEVTQLHQVLMNLCVNARDAMPNGGSLLLSVENADQTGIEVLLHPELKPGPYVMFKVSDTGHGIPKEIIDRIFDPFFTTKEVGKGTGLGLSTVHGIVKSHGGYVTVDSQPGLGATFRVYLPALGVNQAPRGKLAEGIPQLGRGETILVIDDEESIRVTTQHVLESAGFRIRTAGGVEEAIRLLETPGFVPDLVLSDILMPGLDGTDMAHYLRAKHPQLPLLGVSGMDPEQRKEELHGLGFRAVIQKPYDPEVLVQVVSHQLHGS